MYLHEHPEFAGLLRILNQQTGIDEYLIEKDYWIMHVLHGLKKHGFQFELKGGTSLSKGFKLIDRFSEDIDIHIQPPPALRINENPGNCSNKNVKARSDYFDWLASQIRIAGIVKVTRDHEFDNECFTSAGIRLHYESKTLAIPGVKDGILLEAGFDKVTPNQTVDIGSWALDHALKTGEVKIADNTAKDIICYNPEYTFVEKLQTIATKFRVEQKTGIESKNYMRQYYDVYCLLADERVRAFIGTEAYQQHKQLRFPKDDHAIAINANEAFLLSNPGIRQRFADRYNSTRGLYYQGQPAFSDILARIHQYIDLL